MAYLFETEEDEEVGRRRRSTGRRGRGARNEEDGAEITLGTRSLLGIFFGLVLICSIFFGLGYSVGRGSAAKATVASSGTDAPAANANLAKPSPQQALTSAPSSGTDAPSSDTPEESAPALEAAAADAPASAGSGSSSAAAHAAVPAATVKPAGFPSEVPGAANPGVVRPAVATVVPNGIMVQVAAISVPQDADILVQALKKRGYTAVLRNQSQDNLLHVQLGPFASRAEANAMRAKLLADGYNAVVK